jgi:hypothetical protein
MSQSYRPQSIAKTPSGWLLALCALALLVGTYYILRFERNWIDGDTARITRTIQAVHQGGSYLPEGYYYQHGFLYQVLSEFMLEISGLDIETLQISIWPFLSPLLLVLTAFIFYRRLARSSRVALLAVLLLLFQGDVLFVILRGSHEKLDWPLMLLALTLLLHSLSSSMTRRAVSVALFYLLLFAMSTANVFFASVFVAALLVVLLIVWPVSTLQLRSGTENHLPHPDLHRLSILLLSSTLVVFVVMAYVYPPSLANVTMLGTVWDRVSALLLGFQLLENPYAYISFGWVSTGAYLGVSAFTWLLIGSSLLIWCFRGLRLLRTPPSSWLRDELDWLLYAGFAVVVALSILIDLSGILSRNMQLRVFPGFTVVAVLLLARAIIAWFDASIIRRPHRRLPRPAVLVRAYALIFLLLPYFMIASLFKATNEPLLSNKWGFYTPAEAFSLQWSEAHLRDATIWTGADDRLVSASYILLGEPQNDYAAYALNANDRYLLSTELDRERSLRLGMSLPPILDWLHLYDSGQTQLYHRRPATPYQK